MNLYRVLLETNHKFGIKHHPRYARANNINEAWNEANKHGAEWNKTHRNKCVVYSVTFHEAL